MCNTALISTDYHPVLDNLVAMPSNSHSGILKYTYGNDELL